jgi:hypothetical protein
MTTHDDAPDTAEEQAFAKRAESLFEQSVDELDAATRSRLNQGRQAALAELAGSNARFGRWTPWVPATGVAAAAAIAVVMWNSSQTVDPGSLVTPGMAEVADIDILLDEDGLEMLEDLEFYAWLGDEASGGDVG